jgi:hypothetical protein
LQPARQSLGVLYEGPIDQLLLRLRCTRILHLAWQCLGKYNLLERVVHGGTVRYRLRCQRCGDALQWQNAFTPELYRLPHSSKTLVRSHVTTYLKALVLRSHPPSRFSSWTLACHSPRITGTRCRQALCA